MRNPSLKKRFWKQAAAMPMDGGFTVLLDQHRLRTPGGLPLLLPGGALADAVAAEWQAQAEKVDPASMPMTRRARTSSVPSKIDRTRASTNSLLIGYSSAYP